MTDIDKFKTLYVELNLKQYQLFNVKQKEIVDVLVNDFHHTFAFSCYQAVYNQTSISIQYPSHVSISLLTNEHALMIKENYRYIDELIENKHMWGLFVYGELAGFIGIHDEGSMGLLEVLPSYQRHGYGMMHHYNYKGN